MKNIKTHPVVMLPVKGANYIDNGQLWTHDNAGKIKPQLHLWTNTREIIQPHELKGYCVPQHLYILSDEEIKEGDKGCWAISKPSNKIYRIGNTEYAKQDGDKKIVATTDKSLKKECEYCKDNLALGRDYVCGCKLLAQFPESFIQAYIKAYNEGKPITEIELEYEDLYHVIDIGEGRRHSIHKGIIIKTCPDNTVIVHQSKTYSKDDVANFLRRYSISKGNVEDWIKHELD